HRGRRYRLGLGSRRGVDRHFEILPNSFEILTDSFALLPPFLAVSSEGASLSAFINSRASKSLTPPHQPARSHLSDLTRRGPDITEKTDVSKFRSTRRD